MADFGAPEAPQERQSATKPRGPIQTNALLTEDETEAGVKREALDLGRGSFLDDKRHMIIFIFDFKRLQSQFAAMTHLAARHRSRYSDYVAEGMAFRTGSRERHPMSRGIYEFLVAHGAGPLEEAGNPHPL